MSNDSNISNIMAHNRHFFQGIRINSGRPGRCFCNWSPRCLSTLMLGCILWGSCLQLQAQKPVVQHQDAHRQHTEWLTGIRDTSYNSPADYQKNLKHYPFIQLVPDSSLAAVKEIRDLVYADLKGRKLHIDAFLPRPPLHKKVTTPAILIIHGGGWRSGDRSQHIPLAQHLAANGLACFTVEYRLSTEAFFPAAIYDLKAAVRWLRSNKRRFNIDGDKINVLGFSAGGELAAFLGMTNGIKKFDGNEGNNKELSNSSKVNAVIDIDGTLSFVHPEASETQHPDKVGASAWWLGYPRTERLDLWTAASPLTYANNNTVPFIFMNSSLARMHAGRDDFKKIMADKGVLVKVVEFPDTPHSFCLYRPWFPQVVMEVSDFLEGIYDKKNPQRHLTKEPAAVAGPVQL